MFRPFTLEDVYAYAEAQGYKKESVGIEKYCVECDEFDNEIAWEYEVSFGHEYTEYWVWTFEDLSKTATDYYHEIVED